jgi:hypothetical protein
MNLLESMYIDYAKYDDENIGELSQENKDLLKDTTNVPTYVAKYIKDYKKKAEEIINPILSEKAIKYLDIQVKKEKDEFEKNINNKNKCNKNDFKNNITSFLNDNFYYISQKYIIYRVIADVCEPISERIEQALNQLIKDLLSQNNPQDLLEDIYIKKFEDLEEIINGFRDKKNEIYNKKEENIVENEISETSIVINAINYGRQSGLPAPNPINL